MHEMRIIEYGSAAYRDMVTLRDAILRKPLGLVFTPEYLRQEAVDMLIGYYETETGALLGCCILSPVDEELVQLRQMAVRKDLQRSGIGRALMGFAENKAKEQGFGTLMMHARKIAAPFYQRLGYRISGEEFLEVGIPHLEMRKPLA